MGKVFLVTLSVFLSLQPLVRAGENATREDVIALMSDLLAEQESSVSEKQKRQEELAALEMRLLNYKTENDQLLERSKNILEGAVENASAPRDFSGTVYSRLSYDIKDNELTGSAYQLPRLAFQRVIKGALFKLIFTGNQIWGGTKGYLPSELTLQTHWVRQNAPYTITFGHQGLSLTPFTLGRNFRESNILKDKNHWFKGICFNGSFEGIPVNTFLSRQISGKGNSYDRIAFILWAKPRIITNGESQLTYLTFFDSPSSAVNSNQAAKKYEIFSFDFSKMLFVSQQLVSIRGELASSRVDDDTLKDPDPHQDLAVTLSGKFNVKPFKLPQPLPLAVEFYHIGPDYPITYGGAEGNFILSAAAWDFEEDPYLYGEYSLNRQGLELSAGAVKLASQTSLKAALKLAREVSPEEINLQRTVFFQQGLELNTKLKLLQQNFSVGGYLDRYSAYRSGAALRDQVALRREIRISKFIKSLNAEFALRDQPLWSPGYEQRKLSYITKWSGPLAKGLTGKLEGRIEEMKIPGGGGYVNLVRAASIQAALAQRLSLTVQMWLTNKSEVLGGPSIATTGSFYAELVTNF